MSQKNIKQKTIYVVAKQFDYDLYDYIIDKYNKI